MSKKKDKGSKPQEEKGGGITLPACPVDFDITAAIGDLVKGQDLTPEGHHHYQSLAVQWQIARNLSLIQHQSAYNMKTLLLLLKEINTETDDTCEECGK